MNKVIRYELELIAMKQLLHLGVVGIVNVITTARGKESGKRSYVNATIRGADHVRRRTAVEGVVGLLVGVRMAAIIGTTESARGRTRI